MIFFLTKRKNFLYSVGTITYLQYNGGIYESKTLSRPDTGQD